MTEKIFVAKGTSVYKDMNGEWRCVHDRLVFIAGPDKPCPDCEYQDYMESWDAYEKDEVE